MNRDSSLPPFSRPVYFPLLPPLFFSSSRSLRLALIPYLIGSDLINFSENAIKRPPRLSPPPPPIPLFGYRLPPLFTSSLKPLRDSSNLSIQMREPTCTPCVVRRIAFYNREVLLPHARYILHKGTKAKEGNTKKKSVAWRGGEPTRNLANGEKTVAHVYVLFVRRWERNDEGLTEVSPEISFMKNPC